MIEGTALPNTVNPRGPLLHAVVAAAVFLGIQAAAMYWLGQRSRRRTSSEMGAIVVRAGLWSLILSWVLIVGWSGHGPVGLVLPAGLVLVSQLPYWRLVVDRVFGVRFCDWRRVRPVSVLAQRMTLAAPSPCGIVGWYRARGRCATGTGWECTSRHAMQRAATRPAPAIDLSSAKLPPINPHRRCPCG